MPTSLVRIMALARKELLAVLKDRRARLSLLLPALVQTLVFGYGASYDLNRVPYVVFSRDTGAPAAALLARFAGAPLFRQVASVQRQRELRAAIDARRALLGIRIPSDFSRRLAAGRPADVQFIADGRNSNTAGTALGYAQTVVNHFNAEWRATHALPQPPVRLLERAWYNPNLVTRWQMVPGLIGTLTLLQTLLLTAMSVAREREQGTFDQLLVTPLRPVEIMAGKALPAMLIGIAQASGVLLVAQLWFRIPFQGSLFTLYAGLLCFVVSAVGIGLVVSAFCHTMQQAMLFAFMLIMPFSLLSGLATPIANMPAPLRYFTLVNPLRYAIDLAERVYLEGAGLALLWPDIWPLALIAALALGAASWMFRHRLQ